MVFPFYAVVSVTHTGVVDNWGEVKNIEAHPKNKGKVQAKGFETEHDAHEWILDKQDNPAPSFKSTKKYFKPTYNFKKKNLVQPSGAKLDAKTTDKINKVVGASKRKRGSPPPPTSEDEHSQEISEDVTPIAVDNTKTKKLKRTNATVSNNHDELL